MKFLNKVFDLIFDRNDFWHGAQAPGQIYSTSELLGYFNDLTKKIDENMLIKFHVPKVTHGGKKFLHPVTLCQVGLGAYDKYLISQNSKYLSISIKCVEELVLLGDDLRVPYEFVLFNQKTNFQSGLIYGQAISLCLRVAISTDEEIYFKKAQIYKKNMLASIQDGGCYNDRFNLIEEYPQTNSYDVNGVLNGWVSAIWSLYDFYLYTGDNIHYDEFRFEYDNLTKIIENYSIFGWSKYNLMKNKIYYFNIASPYYHREHIAQLYVLKEIGNNSKINESFEMFSQAYSKRYLYFPLMIIKGLTVVMQKFLKKR